MQIQTTISIIEEEGGEEAGEEVNAITNYTLYLTRK